MTVIVRLVAFPGKALLIMTSRLPVVSDVVHCIAPLILLILHLVRGLMLKGSHRGTPVLPSVAWVDLLLVSVLNSIPLAGLPLSRLTNRWSLSTTRDEGLTKYLSITRCLTVKLVTCLDVLDETWVNTVEALGALSLQSVLLNRELLLRNIFRLCNVPMNVVPRAM